MSNILVIGAGLTGLMAAHALVQQGHRVTVVDKGRSVGGRLATRRIGSGHADHGAQFFTVREAAFEAHVQDWLADGVVYEWTRGWSSGPGTNSKSDGHPRYAVRGGMNALAVHLERTLPRDRAVVHVNTKVTAVKAQDAGWRIETDDEQLFEADGLLMTPPVPQSLALLDAGGVTLAEADRAALDRILYDPCLCGLIVLDRSALLPEPGAVQRPNYWVSWIADNQRKGVSAVPLLTLHADAAYSAAKYNAPDDEILSDLEPIWRAYAPDAVVIEAQVKRWRYSQPAVMHPTPTLIAAGLPFLAFAGDAFGERSRIEGAALSGLAAAAAYTSTVR
jgi:predicted NAD/FAD-dependent oxidoreductase